MTEENHPLSTWRVLVGQSIVKFALFATYGAMVSVLLPILVQELDPAGKVASLAAITTAGFVVNAVAQPTIGALSDRTRSRYGRRLPWMAGGAVLGGLALGLTGDARSLLVLGGLWLLVQLGLHGLEVSVDAYLVDAFAPSRRGFAAGVIGLALVAGTSSGTVLASILVSTPTTATWILAAGVVLAVAAFAALVRDSPTPSTELPLRRRRTLDALRAAATTIAEHPDFLKILLWRIGYGISYGIVFAFLLYIVTDQIGVPQHEAPGVVALITVIAGAASAVSVITGGWLSDRMKRRRPFLLIGNAAIILGDVLLLLWPTIVMALVAAALFGIGLGLAISCGRALASQLLPNPERGAAAGLGFLSTAANIGQAAAPGIGALAIGVGGYSGAFVMSAAGAIVCSIAVVFVRSVR